MTTYTGRVSEPLGAKVRNDKGVEIGKYAMGTPIKGDGLENKGTASPWNGYIWMHLISPIVGWMADHLIDYTVDVVTPPPPPPSDDTFKVTISLDNNGVILKPKSIDANGDVVLG